MVLEYLSSLWIAREFDELLSKKPYDELSLDLKVCLGNFAVVALSRVDVCCAFVMGIGGPV